MLFLMPTICVSYVMLMAFFAYRLVLETTLEYNKKIREAEKEYEKLLNKEDDLYKEKIKLENEALEIFTLYEITKEITKHTNEAEAFIAFKRKLKEHVHFKECEFIDAISDQVNENKRSENYFVFTLQGKGKTIGYLSVEGLKEQDKENFMILAHQFALSLRRVKLYEEIEKTAITDSLTELHTRRYSLERLQEEIERSKMRKISMSFLMIDVDHFKSFNDKYGHLAGDQILREIAKIIKENIREIDIAGRYGGEEFCITLPDTDKNGAQYVSERIRRATEEAHIKAYDTNIKTTISVGIATFPDDSKNANELIDKADWALYKAKKQGRNRVCSFGLSDSAA